MTENTNATENSFIKKNGIGNEQPPPMMDAMISAERRAWLNEFENICAKGSVPLKNIIDHILTFNGTEREKLVLALLIGTAAIENIE